MWKKFKHKKILKVMQGLVIVALIASMTFVGVNVDLRDTSQGLNQEPQSIGIGQKTVTIGLDNVAYAAGTPDYSCDGVADDVQFQLAINALPATGGKIVVLAGDYSFNAAVTRAINSVTIEGMGRSTNLTRDGVNPIFTTGVQNNWVFINVRFDAGGVNDTGATLVTYQNVYVGGTYFAYDTSADITADEWDIPTGRGATLVVAASDSSAASKAQADYVVDGTADQVQIQAALDALPAGGGRVLLLEGTYNINEVVTGTNAEDGIWIKDSGKFLEGVGAGTILMGIDPNNYAVVTIAADGAGETVSNVGIRNLMITSTARCAGLTLITAVGATLLENVLIQNIIIDDISQIAAAGGIGITLRADANDEMLDIIMENIWIKDTDANGIETAGLIGGANPLRRLTLTNFRIENSVVGINLTARIYDVIIADGFIGGGTEGITTAGINVNIDSVEIIEATVTGLHIIGNGTQATNMVVRDSARNVYIQGADGTLLTGRFLDSTTEEGVYVVAYDCVLHGYSEGNTKDGLKLQTEGRHDVIWNSVEDGNNGIFVNGADYNRVTGTVYKAGFAGVSLFGATHNTVTGMILRDNGQAADNSYSDLSVSDISNYNRIIGNISEATLATNVHTNFYESGDSTDNVYLGNYASGGQTNRWNLLGTTTTVDHMPESITLDLSGGATDTEVFHAQHDMAIVGYTIYYTEASSGDAGVVVRIGRYQDGVALDGDYFDSVTSEINKNLGYQKVMVSSDMTQKAIAAGDTITVGTAGGKAGTGEVRIVLRIIEAGN
ncbi:hypothetical protein LCGC14_0340820 [marine sediment metagenome]|uniref:Right handed beta helix domain-containing protein n=1 Tax=marine sediment metagenome TaxID=412755 RepID=A0A0F9TDK4_9ZZZZ